MAAHDDRNAGGNRIDIEVMNGVHQVKHLAAEFHRFGSRKTATDAGHIYIAAYRRQRSNLAQPVEDARVSHISSMQNVVRAG